MSRALVIVESPAKARTIHRFLGSDTQVLASMGHVRDLPEVSLGVDVGRAFKPQYVLTTNGKRVVKALRSAAAVAADVYLATDPDREGEAIAWHLQEILRDATTASFHRVTFHEITAAAIHAAFEQPGRIDTAKVDAQQARRVLDRIVGYQVSPLLWKQVRKGTSAGRVQSVALRLVCERERAVQGFQPVEYWNLDAVFRVEPTAETFTARLTQVDGQKPQVGSAEAATALADDLGRAAGFRVGKVAKTPKTQRPPPPFITSTLQQAAGNSLRMTTRQTMRTAQELYEGIELGSQGAVGLITYMRTDSVSVAHEAQDAARAYIGQAYGAEYVPEKPNVFRSRKSAQEAHEAIRPTDVNRAPEQVEGYLSPAQYRLYRLVWNRFVASQMAPARLMEHAVEVAAEGAALVHAYLFRTTSTSTVFPGYLRVYNLGGADPEGGDAAAQADGEPVARRLPDLAVGTPCSLADLLRKQCFTEPPKRYTEAALVRELEQNGVGRPSTYATIVNTIQEREYAKREKAVLVPTPLGFSVNDFLVASLPDLFRVDFTAEMEGQLDRVEEGELDWTGMLDTFYKSFRGWLGQSPGGGAATIEMPPPTAEKALALVNAFPEDTPWDPPRDGGRRVYDDRRFLLSLREQAEAATKPLSERQWRALLTMVARYLDRVPAMRETVTREGLLEQAEGLAREQRAKAQARVAATEAATAAGQPAAQDTAEAGLLRLLTGVTWEPPVKRGRRTFSDERFHQSLVGQVQEGRALSPAQAAAVRKLVAKYRQQIPNCDDAVARLGLPVEAESPGLSPEAVEQVRAVLSLLEQIQEWSAPTVRGKRTYDDREFVQSVRDQFARRGALSDRQVAALRRLLGRYAKQIPGYAEKAAALGLPAAKAPAQPLDAKCPKCGAPLVRRASRFRAFVGCSAFPKCRYIAPPSEGEGDGKAGAAAPAAVAGPAEA